MVAKPSGKCGSAGIAHCNEQLGTAINTGVVAHAEYLGDQQRMEKQNVANGKPERHCCEVDRDGCLRHAETDKAEPLKAENSQGKFSSRRALNKCAPEKTSDDAAGRKNDHDPVTDPSSSPLRSQVHELGDATQLGQQTKGKRRGDCVEGRRVNCVVVRHSGRRCVRTCSDVVWNVAVGERAFGCGSRSKKDQRDHKHPKEEHEGDDHERRRKTSIAEQRGGDRRENDPSQRKSRRRNRERDGAATVEPAHDDGVDNDDGCETESGAEYCIGEKHLPKSGDVSKCCDAKCT